MTIKMNFSKSVKTLTLILGFATMPSLFAAMMTYDPRYQPAGMSPISTMEIPSDNANGGICNPQTNPIYRRNDTQGMQEGFRSYNVPGTPHGPMIMQQPMGY